MDSVQSFANISISEGGNVMLVLGDTGMNPHEKTTIVIHEKNIHIKQNDKTYTSLSIDDEKLFDIIQNANALMIVEIMDEDPIFYSDVTVDG